MPELPEVEHTRQTLCQQVVGKTVRAVKVYRADIIRGDHHATALLEKTQLIRIDRHGKQLALMGRVPMNTDDKGRRQARLPDMDRCVCAHLGMSGSLQYLPITRSQDQSPCPPDALLHRDPHLHVAWGFDDGWLIFRDPRRFGGLWTFRDISALRTQRWSRLGPDATQIRPGELYDALRKTRRAIKVSLLDQQVIAGLGNIYVDELLFLCGIHPLTPSFKLSIDDTRSLVRRMRRLLNQAVRLGGSTLRDYLNPNGQRGQYQMNHRVYGRGEQLCIRCHQRLEPIRIASRATVFCPHCQPRPTNHEH